MRVCKKCGVEKELSQFSLNKKCKYGVTHECKSCFLARQRKWCSGNREKSRSNRMKGYYKYHELNKCRMSEWRKNNQSKFSKSQLSSRRKHSARINASNANRRSLRIQRTPLWANLEMIEVFYWIATKLSKVMKQKYHVDHIIPLQGKNVSGLHVQNNLQVMLAIDNCKKSNHFIT